jgi:hypothetical protein
MEIKIYREPENAELTYDEEQLSEYNSLIEELKLPFKNDITKDKCPNVYICLNTTMEKQLRAICPRKENIEDYKRSTIPIDVLRVYKFAKEQEMFEGFYILYDDVQPDPLLIGWKYLNDIDREKNYSWNRTCYLIARWGDCALELPELLNLGFQRIKQDMIDRCTAAIIDCKAILGNPDVYVRKMLAGTFQDIRVDLSSGGIR